MPGFVAIVQTDVDDVRLTAREGIDLGSGPFGVGEIAGFGDLASGCRGRARAYRIDVEILIARFVLRKQDVLAVAAPEKAGDGAGFVGGDRPGCAERLGGLLDPNVARFVKRFQEGDVLAVRGNLSG